MNDLPAPYPCRKSPPNSPVTIRCWEIDDAAELICSADAFARAAIADEQLAETNDPKVGFVFLDDKPNRRFLEEGGCPAFAGCLNGGSRASVLCRLADVQLHDYLQWKFCRSGRKVYCPIWREKGEKAYGDLQDLRQADAHRPDGPPLLPGEDDQ